MCLDSTMRKEYLLTVLLCAALAEAGIFNRNMLPKRPWQAQLRNKGSRQVAPSTTSPSPSTTPLVCVHDGKTYQPGTSFGEGYDPASNWCYGAFCSQSANVIYWDNFECKTTPTTTLPPITPPSTPVPGCDYMGQVYPLDSVIDSGYDEASNWCYGTLCSDRGEVLAWDNFHCKSTTLPPTTTILPPTPPAVTTGP